MSYKVEITNVMSGLTSKHHDKAKGLDTELVSQTHLQVPELHPRSRSGPGLPPAAHHHNIVTLCSSFCGVCVNRPWMGRALR